VLPAFEAASILEEEGVIDTIAPLFSGINFNFSM
jgi:hypothetical protein